MTFRNRIFRAIILLCDYAFCIAVAFAIAAGSMAALDLFMHFTR